MPISSARKARLADTLLKHEDRRTIAGKALAFGLLVTFIGLLLDYLVRHLHWPWFNERLFENVIEGVLFAALAWIVLSAREKRLQRRFREVGYLNHHIRNSLTVIEMAEGHIAEAGERLKMVSKASTRIRRCIEKISREEDCDINEQFPQEP